MPIRQVILIKELCSRTAKLELREMDKRILVPRMIRIWTKPSSL